MFSEKYNEDILGLFAKSRTYFELRFLIKQIHVKKVEKNEAAAEKRSEKEKKKFEEAVKKGVELALKRKEEGEETPIEFPNEPKPKKFRKGVKGTRDYTKIGHFST